MRCPSPNTLSKTLAFSFSPSCCWQDGRRRYPCQRGAALRKYALAPGTASHTTDGTQTDTQGASGEPKPRKRAKRAEPAIRLAGRKAVDLLPDNVLAMILAEAYVHYFPHCRLHSGLVTDSAVVASHVCTRWRSMALRMPALWACIHVTKAQGPKHPLALRAFLKRSRKWPLSVMFLSHHVDAKHHWNYIEDTGPWEAFDDYWPQFELCWDLVMTHKHRIRDLAAYTGHCDAVHHIQSTLAGQAFPKLEYLQIMMDSFVETDFLRKELDMRAPFLIQLRLHVIPVINNLNVFDGLCELVLDGFEKASQAQVIRALARASPTLESLALRLCDLTSGNLAAYSASNPPVHFPCLRSLFLQDIQEDFSESVDDGSRESLLHMLLKDATKLETFYCCDTGGFLAALGEGPLSLPAVRSLTCNRIPGYRRAVPQSKKTSWANFISTFQAVESVQFHDPRAFELLRATQEADNGAEVGCSSALPALRSLDLSVNNEQDVTCLLEFVQHRITVGRPLRTLKLFADDAPEDEQQRLRSALEAISDMKVVWRDESVALDPLEPWDVYVSKPNFLPWGHLLEFEDQFGNEEEEGEDE